jgi:elongation factor 1 alpha-like protein
LYSKPLFPAILMQAQVSRILQASKLLSSYNLAPHTAKSFFQDCPWLNVPSHRRAEILVKPVLPRFGLLGGSSTGEGKMSKLAALAAKRRQKENEKRQDPAADTETVVGDFVSSLRKLRDTTRNDPDSPKGRSLQPLQDFGFSSPREHSQRRDSLKQILSSPKQEENNRRSENVDAREQSQFEEDLADLRAKPSSFAQTLTECQDQASFFPLESSTFPNGPLVSPFDFTKPSPDDVVLKAQNCKGPQ